MVDNAETQSFDTLTNLYSVPKTLRFELKPQYSTLENIQKNQIVEKGEDLKSHYKIFKEVLDQVFCRLIDESLDQTYLDVDLIKRYKEFSFKPRDQITEKDRTELKKLKDLMKKQVDKCLDNKEKKAVFNDPAKYLLENVSEFSDIIAGRQASIEAFNKQKGYLAGYFQNRQNIFDRTTNETSVAFRVVEDNLPIFLNNQAILKNFLDKIEDKEKFTAQIEKTIQDLDLKINLETFFDLDYFNRTLSQSGIEKYNLLIAGKAVDKDTKIEGLNELINKYLQDYKTEKLKKIKLKKLYKQILSENQSESFRFEFIETNEDLFSVINSFARHAYQTLEERIPFFEKIESLKNCNGQENILSQVSLERKNIKRLSAFIFKDYSFIEQHLEESFLESIDKATKKALDDHRKTATFSIKDIYDSLQDMQYEQNGKTSSSQFMLLAGIPDFLYQDLDCGLTNLLEVSKSFNQQILDLSQEYSSSTEDHTENESKDRSYRSLDANAIRAIKSALDFYKNLQRNLSLFYVSSDHQDVNNKSEFSYEFDDFYTELREIIPVYNRARNFLTKKPFSSEKTKLIFNNPHLLDGWSKSKESDCLGTIFKKGEKYYIGVINSQTKAKAALFDDHNFSQNRSDQEFYEKMNLYFLSDLKRDFPKKYFSEKWHSKYPIPADLHEKYEYYRFDEHKDERQQDLAYHHRLIAYYQECLKKDEEWQVYNFQLKDPKNYTNVTDFLTELAPSTYRMEFTKIPASYIKKLVSDGKLYFFQIYSKDFSEKSKGKPNLHTLYFKAVFDQQNAKLNYNYKISGSAEIFYRPASLEYKVTHPKNQAIKNKNKDNPKKESTFVYDLSKDRRYMEDKFFLHLPIELNRTPHFTGDSIVNKQVNQLVGLRKKNYILGIDRGERHLIYLVLIDEDGKIIRQQTLNSVSSQYRGQNGNMEQITTNYHDLLDAKEKQRKKNLQDWQTIENIKELKSGFLSNVVNEIGKIITEHQPIIMLENLNSGFKNSRIKIEKQVYQKFEKALIDKFNYFIRKDIDPDQSGGLYHALQLTKGYSKQYNGKQNGIIYYIPANYTSNIDPTTGFISSFIPTKYENIEKAKNLFSTFDDIFYDQAQDLFCFIANYKKFRPDTNLWDQKVWQIYTYGDRIKTTRFQNRWQSRPADLDEDPKELFSHGETEYRPGINLNEEFKKLFDQYSIDYLHNLQLQITSQDSATFYQEIMHLLKLTLQMRNSRTVNPEDKEDKEDKTKQSDQDQDQAQYRNNDYIISPVKNQNGIFYDSRRDYEEWPENADANGAYNIARKGLLVLKHLKEGVAENKICNITTEEWAKFAEDFVKNKKISDS